MKKTPAHKPMPAQIDPKEQGLLNDPRSEFLSAAFGLSWQLAVVFLVPVIAGVELGQHLHQSLIFTSLGFFIAIVGVVMVIKKTLKDFTPGVKK